MLKNSFREGHHPTDVHQSSDAKQIMDFYREFPKASNNSQVILTSLDGLLAKLRGEAEVKALLKSSQELRALFLAMLYPCFYEFEHSFELIRLAHVLHFVSPEMRRTLSLWLCDISAEEMLPMVEGVQTVLSVELLKLQPDSGESDIEAV